MELYKIAASNLKGIGRTKLKQLLKKTNGLSAFFERSTNELSELFGVKKELVRKIGRKEALAQAEDQLTSIINTESKPFIMKTPDTLNY